MDGTSVDESIQNCQNSIRVIMEEIDAILTCEGMDAE